MVDIIKKISIDRAKWARGIGWNPNYHGTNKLWLSKLNAGCCLGHALNQVENIPLESMEGFGDPYRLNKETFLTGAKETTLLGDLNSDYQFANNQFAKDAMQINDDKLMKDPEREGRLIQLFKDNGYELEFYG